MERAAAIRKLGKLLGRSLGYRVNDKTPTREDRAAAKADLPAAIAARNALRERKDARYRALLAADEEYQTLHAACKVASEHVDKLSSITRHYKITVGTSDGPFFHVKAEADSWEEIIDKLTEKQNVAA